MPFPDYLATSSFHCLPLFGRMGVYSRASEGSLHLGDGLWDLSASGDMNGEGLFLGCMSLEGVASEYEPSNNSGS